MGDLQEPEHGSLIKDKFFLNANSACKKLELWENLGSQGSGVLWGWIEKVGCRQKQRMLTDLVI